MFQPIQPYPGRDLQYRFNPSFDGLYASDPTTSYFTNYMLRLTNQTQQDLFNYNGGGGYQPIPIF
jgi:hypothetical protein